MKLSIFSDIHLEFGSPFKIPTAVLDQVDLIILAGDIHTKTRGIDWIAPQVHQRKIPVLYVLGNHEYYGESHPHLLDKIREKTLGTTIHLLENETYLHGDFAFYGGTMWTNFNLFGNAPIAKEAARQQMNDYRYIRKSDADYRHIRPDDLAEINTQFTTGLEAFLSTHQDKRKVVITHHPPCIKSTEEHFRNDICTAAYINDMTEILHNNNIELWCSGHCHKSSDYVEGNTRLVSNPYGYYINSENTNFNWDLIVEL